MYDTVFQIYEGCFKWNLFVDCSGNRSREQAPANDLCCKKISWAAFVITVPFRSLSSQTLHALSAFPGEAQYMNQFHLLLLCLCSFIHVEDVVWFVLFVSCFYATSLTANIYSRTFTIWLVIWLLKLAIEALRFSSQLITVSFVFSLTAVPVTRIWFFQTFVNLSSDLPCSALSSQHIL